MYLFLLFLAIPLIEIALFIQVGGAIGLWLTLLSVFITAWVGAALVRKQGLDTLARLNDQRHAITQMPELLTDGAFIIGAGALLLTPGFFTDAVGFVLLWPPARRTIAQKVAQKLKARSHSTMHSTAYTRDDIIETPYEIHNDPNNPR